MFQNEADGTELIYPLSLFGNQLSAHKPKITLTFDTGSSSTTPSCSRPASPVDVYYEEENFKEQMRVLKERYPRYQNKLSTFVFLVTLIEKKQKADQYLEDEIENLTYRDLKQIMNDQSKANEIIENCCNLILGLIEKKNRITLQSVIEPELDSDLREILSSEVQIILRKKIGDTLSRREEAIEKEAEIEKALSQHFSSVPNGSARTFFRVRPRASSRDSVDKFFDELSSRSCSEDLKKRLDDMRDFIAARFKARIAQLFDLGKSASCPSQTSRP